MRHRCDDYSAAGEPGSLVGTLSDRAKEPTCITIVAAPLLSGWAIIHTSTTVTPRKSERPVDVVTASVVFFLGAAISLATSWVLVSRLERVGERFGLSEALLGVTAALAADAPEITAAVTALIHHQQAVGAGVVIGSNVFNLATLLGLGAVVAGRVHLHRRVVLLGARSPSSSRSCASWPWPVS